MSDVIRVLVVDDSAFVRKVVREMLSRSPYMEVVGVARDGEEALEMVEQLHPHVVTCDLNMPGVDGLSFVRRQMARRPLPILILSVASEDAGLALQALDAGAVDFVQKPTALASEDLFRIREELVEKVKAAALAPIRALAPPAPVRAAPDPAFATARHYNFDIVVIGISTGGPQALRKFLPLIPANFPVPIAIVLHMPVGFTALFAEKLKETCPLNVKEAAEGDPVRAGHALIAQAGRHLRLNRTAEGVVAHLTRQPAELLHCPSVDVLFQSASEVYGERVLGVVMTGMGNDGRAGAAWIKAQGGSILTEAEESCVIYGMPRSVVEAGLSDGAVPLEGMAQAIINHL